MFMKGPDNPPASSGGERRMPRSTRWAALGTLGALAGSMIAGQVKHDIQHAPQEGIPPAVSVDPFHWVATPIDHLLIASGLVEVPGGLPGSSARDHGLEPRGAPLPGPEVAPSHIRGLLPGVQESS
jgi:hypothetical protein